MSIFCFCYLLTLSDSPNALPIHTGIYAQLNPHCVATSASGQVCVLNRQEQTLTVYDREGTVLSQFGGHGQGPGEFNWAFEVFWQNARIYVWDLEEQAITTFTSTGQCVARSLAPIRGIDMARSQDGWVYGAWHTALNSEPDQAVSLYLSGEQFNQPRIIAQVKGNGYGATFIADGDHSIYTPVQWVPMLATSPDGKEIYLLDQEHLWVKVFDNKGTLLREWREAMPRLEFNPDWADIRLKEVKAMFPERRYQTNYYATFPVVRSFRVDPAGNWVFRLWTREPHLTEVVKVNKPNGESVESNLTWSDYLRWYGLVDGKALVGHLDDSDEMVLE
ncbi:MAG: hypothetical protein KDC71_16695, partial [Acidobacteria bacterium]|nr:hypothetical protein [Acidobacteriota bacterium]